MKTNKKHFKVFKKECKKLIGSLGLFDWELCFTHNDLDCRGNCHTQIPGFMCKLNLGVDWGEGQEYKITNKDIKRTAFHEVLHLLLTEIRGCANDRYMNIQEYDEIEHRTIRRIENFLMKNTKGKLK